MGHRRVLRRRFPADVSPTRSSSAREWKDAKRQCAPSSRGSPPPASCTLMAEPAGSVEMDPFGGHPGGRPAHRGPLTVEILGVIADRAAGRPAPSPGWEGVMGPRARTASSGCADRFTASMTHQPHTAGPASSGQAGPPGPRRRPSSAHRPAVATPTTVRNSRALFARALFVRSDLAAGPKIHAHSM